MVDRYWLNERDSAKSFDKVGTVINAYTAGS